MPVVNDRGKLADPAERSRFGFDASDDAWLSRCREAEQGPAPSRLGLYELLGDAGRGSQGSVYKARQPGTGRIIAIKRLGAGRFATPRMTARFDLEIAALSALNHPGVVTVFGADEVEGQRILLMEWIDGDPIDRWAASRPVRERLEVFARVCDAVNHAHQRGIIHRDLKPSNILVDRGGAPHVLDFGLARLTQTDAGPEMSRTEAFVGTPAYAAPEQVASPGDIDTRTDVYALGAVLYELLTGSPPLNPRSDLGAMIDAIRAVEPARPSVANSRLSPELDPIVLKALAKEPAHRYQSVADLGDDVRRYLAGEAVLAHPPSRLYRARKFVRRHRAGVTAFTAVALTLIAGAAATAVQAVRATRAEAQAGRERDAALLEVRRADAVRDFLTKMLSQATPRAGRRSAMTVREALDQAAARLDAGALKDQPEIEDAVRWTLGWTYIPLRARAAAAAQFEWVAGYRERALGASSPKLADALASWAGELNALGRLDQSMDLTLRAIEIYRVTGPGQFNLEQARMNVAQVARKRRDPRAEQLFLELIGDFDRLGAKYRRDRAWMLYELALLYRDTRRTDDCIAAFERARVDVERFFPIASTQRMWLAIDYCLNVTQPAGRHQDTIDVIRPVLEAAREPFGDENRDIDRLTALLAEALIETGRAAEAEPLLRGLLEARDRTLPADEPRRHTARSLLGWSLAHLGRIEEAEALLVPAFEALDADPLAAATQRAGALDRIIRFYEGLGMEANAAHYRARLPSPG